MSPIEAIGKPEVHAFLEYQIVARGLYSARHSRAVLQSAFSWGQVSTKWRLTCNPAADLAMEEPKGRIVIFSDTEIRHLVAAADLMGSPSVGDSIMLGLFTGQRQGDRLQLEDAGLIDGRRQFRQSKTGAVVAIREAPQLSLRLETARTCIAELCLKFGFDKARRPTTVLVCEATGRPWNQNTYQNNFARIRAAAAAGILRQTSNRRS